MISIDDFAENTKTNDTIIQLSLMEIDTQDLAYAMIGYTEVGQEAVLRNMSKRAIRLLQDEVELQRDQAPDHVILSATRFFNQRLRKNARYIARSDDTTREKLEDIIRSSDIPKDEWPAINIDDEEGIVDTFIKIQALARKHGILALEGLESRVENSFMRKALEFLIDGWEPLLMQSILETYKQSYLRNVEKQLDMILEGIDSLASKDMPLVTEERLRAHISA